MAVHTALTAKDASLHLKLQHGFHNAQVSVWVDGDLAYSGKVTGSIKKRFGLIPTDSVQGSLSQIILVRSGQHNVRVRIEPDDATMQEDGISGDFAHNSERELSVSARQSRLSLSWLGTSIAPAETSSSFGWFLRYGGSLLLTIGGSIMSALTGYAIKELPGRASAIGSRPRRSDYKSVFLWLANRKGRRDSHFSRSRLNTRIAIGVSCQRVRLGLKNHRSLLTIVTIRPTTSASRWFRNCSRASTRWG